MMSRSPELDQVLIWSRPWMGKSTTPEPDSNRVFYPTGGQGLPWGSSTFYPIGHKTRLESGPSRLDLHNLHRRVASARRTLKTCIRSKNVLTSWDTDLWTAPSLAPLNAVAVRLFLTCFCRAASQIWNLAPSVFIWLCSTATSTPNSSRGHQHCGRSALLI